MLVMLLGSAWLLAPAQAYVISGPHILELMTQTLVKAQRLLVAQRLVLHTPNGQTDKVELLETLRYVFPETFRSDIQTANIQRVHLRSKRGAITVLDGRVALEPESRYDRYKDLLLINSRMLLVERLSALGVNVNVSSLGRFQDQTAFVVGARYPDESVPQVWIQKDTFRPLRWIISPGAGGQRREMLEVRYSQWQKFDQTWYPLRIDVYKNNALVREIHALDITVNPAFSEGLFNIDQLRRSLQAPAAAVTAPKETEGLDEVQKIIEDFKKIYE